MFAPARKDGWRSSIIARRDSGPIAHRRRRRTPESTGPSTQEFVRTIPSSLPPAFPASCSGGGRSTTIFRRFTNRASNVGHALPLSSSRGAASALHIWVTVDCDECVKLLRCPSGLLPCPPSGLLPCPVRDYFSPCQGLIGLCCHRLRGMCAFAPPLEIAVNPWRVAVSDSKTIRLTQVDLGVRFHLCHRPMLFRMDRGALRE